MDMKTFKNPPVQYRPAPFWSWNDRLDKDELKRQIHEMSEKGMGGYFMHSRVGLVTGYLSDEWMEDMKACLEAARETGTLAWLYDEDKWPSGFAGGMVPEMSEAYRSRGLVLLSQEEITENDTVLTETTLNGSPVFICKRISPLSDLWFNGASYVDLMNPEAVDAFLNSTHERYKEVMGDSFGKEIPGIFTDEPCYLMEGKYDVPVVPWSDYLPGFFQKLKGYAITDHLVELFIDTGDYQSVRFDFYDSATRLFLESFSKKYYDWCTKNNLKLTGHFMAEDRLAYQTQWIGAAMPHYQFMHWPGIDKLSRHLDQVVTVKQLTSAVDQLGKERALCEVFGCVGQQVSFFHRKWISDWQAALGISYINSHLSLYSMRGERKRDYPSNLFFQQPWWKEEKLFSDYGGRLCAAVSQGKRNVDILVVHPVSSVWSTYSPLHKENNLMVENGLYNDPFERLSKELAAQKLDYHYGDEILMEEHARVENGKLIIGNHSYSTVIVPPSLTLRKNTVKLLSQFVKEAGTARLLILTPAPQRVDGHIEAIQVLEKVRHYGTLRKLVQALDGLYPERVRVIDKATGDNAPMVLCHSRTTDEGEVLFFANTDDKREIHSQIHINSKAFVLILDLTTGETYGLPQGQSAQKPLEVTFHPAGSLLLFVPRKAAPEVSFPAAPAVLESGVAFHIPQGLNGLVTEFTVKPLEDNVLPLNDATLYINGKKVLDKAPLAKAMHAHFYSAPEGTPFKVEYEFQVRSLPQGALWAAVEMGENLDRITLNGKETKALKAPGEAGAFDPEKSWKDPNFTRVPLTGLLSEGTNLLVLEGKKVNNITGPGFHKRLPDFKTHRPTEAETVYLVGSFKVADINREIFFIDGPATAAKAGDLTEQGYPFYSGQMEYTASFRFTGAGKPVYLKLNTVEAACVSVEINGRPLGVKAWAPYVFHTGNALKDGENTLRIVASTTLFNVMGPNRISGIVESPSVGPRTFIDFGKSKDSYTLLPFGVKSAALYTE